MFIKNLYKLQNYFLFKIDNDVQICFNFELEIPNNIIVFPLNETNVSDITRLQIDSFPKNLHDSEEDIRLSLEWPIAYGLSVQENFIGTIFGFFENDIFHLYSIEVNQNYRYKNIGSILLECAIVAALLKSKDQNLKIEKCIAKAVSEGGKSLLKRYGFEKIGQCNIEDYIADIMELEMKYLLNK